MYKYKKHIFFDLDHTLWDFDKNSELVFQTIFQDYHPNINTTDFIEKYVPINQACWKLFQKDIISSAELRYKRLRDSFDGLDYHISDSEISFISDKYLELLSEQTILFEGTIEILDYLKSKYDLHIITNGFAEVQARKIENSGLKPYFSTITNSEMAGVKKPNPKIYEHSLQIANAKKRYSIMIGDCIDADVNGALEFGIDAILFNPNNQNIEDKIIAITQLMDLKKYF